MKEALLYESLDKKKVKCNLCNHRCVIKNGKRGICMVRENQDGVLQSLVYGKLIAQHIDPIEKKPLFHFMPGTQSYSVASVGCNFKCRFCQNADIAQMPADKKMIVGDLASPEDVVNAAEKSGCKSIAYTYTEPTVYFEFALDTAKLAHQKGIKNVFVTNGYMSPEAIETISPWLDAANVDLKSFSNDFYKKICGAKLKPVLNTLKLMKSLGIFVEVTTLLITGLNDDPKELTELVDFIVKSLGPETPWHVSRFHPCYRLTDRPATSVESLKMARQIGMERGLQHVFVGNVPGDNSESTFCYSCGKLLIDRWGFFVKKNLIKDGKCPDCGALINIV
ncbi:pyruvate formate lyase activating enzyme [Candidatus Magnetomoraceae bacterium gMMP-15]